MPAASTSRANAASYAVIIVMRLPSRFIATTSDGDLLGDAGAPPYEEPRWGAAFHFEPPSRPAKPVPALPQS